MRVHISNDVLFLCRSPDLTSPCPRITGGEILGTVVLREIVNLVLGDCTRVLWSLGPSGFT